MIKLSGMLNYSFSRSFALDLGNNNTVVTDDQHILVSQPSYIVFDEANSAVKAVGDAAYDIFEKNHSKLRPVKPMHWGVIADYDSAAKMIRRIVSSVYQTHWFSKFDRIVCGVPFATTAVERQALVDSLDQFGARKTNLLFEPLAAAIGMRLNIREPEGKMVIDIGGGITEIVIISLSGIAVFQSIKTAGDSFTEEIKDYFRQVHQLSIGWKTAEKIKLQVGAALVDIDNPPPPVTVSGKDIREGLPVQRMVDHREIARVLEKSLATIERSIINVLEVCPPELAADIYESGIHLTGGSALLRGLPERLQRSIQLPVHRDAEPLLAVGKGISEVLRDPKHYRSILI